MMRFEKILVHPGTTVRQALEVIDSGAMKIALVVDVERHLLGTISDGDIRRALLRGVGLDARIDDLYNASPTTCAPNTTREEILRLAGSRSVYQIPIVDVEGHVLGVAVADDLINPRARTSKVVLMAGGLGTRLSPLTDTVPKPMLQIGDKPILEHVIRNFSRHGYTDIVLSVNYKSDVIENHFGDGSGFGVAIHYVRESKRMGTAGALSLMREQLTEPFFVMNGDLLTNLNFEHMQDFHESHGARATMAVRECDFQVPYGVVKIADGRILSIEEKPTHKFYVSCGIYMLSPQVLGFIPDDKFFDMPALFQAMMERGDTAVSFPIREYWLDVGQMSDYERAKIEFGQVDR